jgi:Fungal specific transcription factor domain
MDIAETVFVLAARFAKSTGIHQWQFLQGKLSDEDVQERRNISYCLYILDKKICWTTGSTPSIPISSVNVDSTLMSSDDSTTANLAAKAILAQIEETIYLELYASQVEARTEDQVRRVASTISQKLQGWLADTGTDLEEVENVLESSTFKVESAILFLCAQLLFTLPHKSHPDVIFRQSHEVARRCMRLLLRLWHSPPDPEYHAAFPL